MGDTSVAPPSPGSSETTWVPSTGGDTGTTTTTGLGLESSTETTTTQADPGTSGSDAVESTGSGEDSSETTTEATSEGDDSETDDGGENRPPEAFASTHRLREDQPAPIELDVEDPEGQPLALVVISPPSHGTLQGPPNDLLYSPKPDYHGTDEFVFQVDDGELLSEPARVTLTIAADPDAPRAESQRRAVAVGQPLALMITAIDPDGDDVQFHVEQQPQHGTLEPIGDQATGSAMQLTYHPNPRFRGRDSFTFVADDGSLSSESATIALEIGQGDDAPVALGRTMTSHGGEQILPLAGEDPEGKPVQARIAILPEHGTIEAAAFAGRYGYRPTPGFNGVDRVAFRVNDGHIDSSLSWMEIEVGDINQPPEAESFALDAEFGDRIEIELRGDDPEGAPVEFVVLSKPRIGELTGTSPRFEFRHTSDTYATAFLTYVARAGDQQSEVGVITLNLSPSSSSDGGDSGDSGDSGDNDDGNSSCDDPCRGEPPFCSGKATRRTCVDNCWVTTTCEGGSYCTPGGCVCRKGEVTCDGSCIDPRTDEDYCGVDAVCGGGSVCADDEACVEGACLPSRCDGHLSFDDPAITADIERRVGPGPWTREDLSRISNISIVEQGISSLGGLECLPGLTALNFNRNKISDLTPLAGLSELHSLWLNTNAISDLSPLSGLRKLNQLLLSNNAIHDVTPLATLTELEDALTLHNNKISDLSPLSHLTKLRELGLNGNGIRELAAIANLTGLTRLSLELNEISDLTPLAGLAALDILILNHNEISDLTPLAGLGELTQLTLNANRINNLEPLAGLGKLQALALNDNNGLNDLRPLAGLSQLHRLSLEHNKIDDVTPLAGLSEMRELQLGNNAISKLEPLSGLTRLETLRLDANNISELGPLAALTNLDILWIHSNGLSDLSALAGLTRLEMLWLQSNKISNLKPIAGLTSLIQLRLDANDIRELGPLTSLTALERLNLDNNSIDCGLQSTNLGVLETTVVTNNGGLIWHDCP